MWRVDLPRLEVVVGVIKSSPIGLQRLRTQNCVVHYAFHAVPISRVARTPQQITGQLEVGVRATRRFKAAMALAQAGGHFFTVWAAEGLIRAPAAAGKTLLRQHANGIL